MPLNSDLWYRCMLPFQTRRKLASRVRKGLTGALVRKRLNIEGSIWRAIPITGYKRNAEYWFARAPMFMRPSIVPWGDARPETQDPSSPEKRFKNALGLVLESPRVTRTKGKVLPCVQTDRISRIRPELTVRFL